MQNGVFLCQWRSAAKKKQEDDDFGFAREVRDREKRLQALEEQLEERARFDCDDFIRFGVQTHVGAVCMGGFGGCVFFPNTVSGRKSSTSVKQSIIANGSIT